LRLGATAACLDVEEAVVGIHRIREHPPEFHALDRGPHGVDIVLERNQGGVVILGAGELVELLGIAEPLIDALQGADGVFERLALPAEILSPLAVLPDGGVFDQGADFVEALALGIEVKDTS
jgi:hypothetical protein